MICPLTSSILHNRLMRQKNPHHWSKQPPDQWKQAKHTNTAVVCLLDDWSYACALCALALRCLLSDVLSTQPLKTRTTWLIRLSSGYLVEVNRVQSGSEASPKVILIPRQDPSGREKSWRGFIILLCKCNLCDRSDLDESLQTQKMTLSLSFKKSVGRKGSWTAGFVLETFLTYSKLKPNIKLLHRQYLCAFNSLLLTA